MLEKIGLPSKPSMRGGNWVVDASHCQGCSSQFTFINRKHHCRRCGGLFCNSCTQQRMVLRGQGDSPVRICNPCKSLEEAARFELRYGHKARAAKGSARQALKHEEVLSQILGTDAKQPLVSANEKHIDTVSDLLRTPSGSSASLQEDHAASSVSEAHIFQSSSVDVQSHPLNDIGSISPDELRQRAVDEKKKYKILKGEGKSDEALQAFKRGKELERQAAALEIAIRKSRRIVSKTSTLSSVLDTNKQVGSEETGSKKKQVTSRVHNDEKNDLASELRELGWSEADLNNEKKTAKLSLEGELSSLLGEIPRKASHAKGGTSVDKSLVIAHKKKALTFKREGKLAEAKEELKKAKILEKQIEEQELLGEEEDSEDELSALVNSMEDDDKHDDLLLDHGHGLSVNLHHLLGTANELASDGDFDVTDEDMNDPELAAALKSFGWAEEDDVHADDIILKSVPLDREAMMSKVLALKREALGQKRAGNASQAMDLLKKAKLLERGMEDMQLDGQTAAPESIKKTSPSQIFGESSIAVAENLHIKPPLGSKTVIQKELLAVKRKALALRREGRIEEAEEELKIAKVLEGQLEEMENAAKSPDVKPVKKNAEFNQRHKDGPGNLALEEGGVDADVTEQDMHDPALLSVLKNLGWQDEDDEATSMASKFAQPVKDHSYSPPVMPVKARKSKGEIQRELLGLKRKALALRRQGKTEEADEELERAKALEQQIAEMEVSHGISFTKVESNAQEEVDKKNAGVELKATVDIGQKNDQEKAKPPGTSSPPVSDSHSHGKSGPAESWLEDWVSGSSKSAQPVGGLDPLPHNESKVLLVDNKKLAQKEDSESRYLSQVNAFTNLSDQINVKEDISTKSDSVYQSVSRAQMNDRHESKAAPNDMLVLPEQKSKDGDDNLKDEILAHKKKALALKREGKLAEAREELRQAKLLEKSLEDSQQPEVDSRSTPASVPDGTPVVQEESKPSKPKQTQKPMSSRNRLKLQQESLAHKRNALKLRREGKIAESEAELELSKALESQLEEFGDEGSGASKGAAGDVIVEDLLDPQLMLALKSIGWNDNDMLGQSSKNPEPKPDAGKGGKSATEKAHLEEQIRNEKINALNLKREGKQAEALEALRTAKRLEKKLASLNS